MLWSWLKTIITILASIALVLYPIGEAYPLGSTIVLCSIFFFVGLILPYLLIVLSPYSRQEMQAAQWSDPIDFKYLQSLIQFIGILLVAAGLSNLIGSSLDGQLFNGQGLAMIIAGIGIRLGMILGLMSS